MKTEIAEAAKKVKSKGGRPPKSVIRTELLAVRLLPVEKKAIVEKARTAGLTHSEWFRKAALRARIIPRLSAEETHYLRVLSGLANNLNQLTKLAHGKGLHHAITAIIEVLERTHRIMEKLFKDDR
jgi:hypothetical protein